MAQRGTYTGLLHGGAHATDGLITLALNANGSFTARLTLAGIPRVLLGASNAAGDFSGSMADATRVFLRREDARRQLGGRS